MAGFVRLQIICSLFGKSICFIELVLLFLVILTHIFIEFSLFAVVFLLFLTHIDHFFVEFGINDSKNLVDVHVRCFSLTRTAVALITFIFSWAEVRQP